MSAEMQELNDIKEILKIKRDKYIKYKLLYDAVEECLKDPNSPPNVKDKVQDIVLSQSCIQTMLLQSEGFSEEATKLLGIVDLTDSKLSYNESAKLKRSLINNLENKHETLCKKFAAITNENIETTNSYQGLLDFNLNKQDSALLEFYKKLVDQKEQFLENLLQQQEILEEISKLRLEHLPKVLDDKVKECQIKSYINTLRTEIIKEKTRIDIFTETDNALAAYEEVMKDIKQQQDECNSSIQDLEKLKEKYRQIACKPFDELLKSYIHYKSLLAKKREMYELLNN